jgi:hypothetical protein
LCKEKLLIIGGFMPLALDQHTSAKAKPVFSFGMTSVFDLWYKQWTFYYKFSCGCGMTEANIPTAQSPGR